MPHNVSVTIEIGGNAHRLRANFADEEWDSLAQFLAYTAQLQETRICKNGAGGSATVSFKAGVGWSFNTALPPDDDFIALLHRLRPFLLKDEATNFYKIGNILSRRLESEEFRDFFKKLKAFFSGRRFQDVVSISSNTVVVNSEETLMKWLNAHEYHKDRDKQRELETLHKVVPLKYSRAIFAMMIFDMVKAIFALSGLVGTVTGQQESFKCTVP
jgi:hypothetical protein